MNALPEDHYRTLRVDRQATAHAVRKAYRALAQQFHPDRCPQADGPEQMARINAAYEVLSDAVSRTHYDALLAAREGRPAQRRAVPRQGLLSLSSDFRRAWVLGAGVTSLVLLTTGFVAFKQLPANDVPVMNAAVLPPQDMEPLMLVPARRLESLAAPMRRAGLREPEREPVMRLVRSPSLMRNPATAIQ